MQETKDIIDFLREKERACRVMTRAYNHWLFFLTPVRWATIFIGVVFPAFAGISFLRHEEVIWGMPWQTVAAWATFIASVVAALHSALHCESHQLGCQRLRARYCALADEFKLAIILDEKLLRKKADELRLKFAKLDESTTETPTKWAIDKAEREIPLVRG
jgi:hypothetical protein